MLLCCMFYVLTPNYECPTTESRERRDIINALLEKLPPATTKGVSGSPEEVVGHQWE